MPTTRLNALARRIEDEYRELPGLQLTRWQVARLWALDPVECDMLLETLVRAKVLRETPRGFVRREGVGMTREVRV